jgi:hypothetical protein
MPDIQINIWYGDEKWVGEIVELRDTGPVVVFETTDGSWDLVVFRVAQYLMDQTRFAH